jgi:hypothetical protein
MSTSCDLLLLLLLLVPAQLSSALTWALDATWVALPGARAASLALAFFLTAMARSRPLSSHTSRSCNTHQQQHSPHLVGMVGCQCCR